MLAVGNFEQLLFEDCTFEGYDKPILLVGTEDKVEVVRSGDMELRKATFEECIAAHPGVMDMLFILLFLKMQDKMEVITKLEGFRWEQTVNPVAAL